MQRIIVTGASSQVGDFLLPRLSGIANGQRCKIIALSRLPETAPRTRFESVEWRHGDLREVLPPCVGAEAVIHLAPLWLLPERLPELAACGVTRIVALGSTSVFTKSTSADPAELETAQRLAKAEAAISEFSQSHDIAWTILRPTMIYGAGRDRNIGAIAAFIVRWGVFPVAGDAHGLRAPVHAEDVAQACLAALLADAAKNRSYQIAGGETLSYRRMVERVFTAMGKTPRVITLPEAFLQVLAAMASGAGVSGINAQMVRRMNLDQVFDYFEATRDFDYAPRGFEPEKT